MERVNRQGQGLTPEMFANRAARGAGVRPANPARAQSFRSTADSWRVAGVRRAES